MWRRVFEITYFIGLINYYSGMWYITPHFCLEFPLKSTISISSPNLIIVKIIKKIYYKSQLWEDNQEQIYIKSVVSCNSAQIVCSNTYINHITVETRHLAWLEKPCSFIRRSIHSIQFFLIISKIFLIFMQILDGSFFDFPQNFESQTKIIFNHW